VASRLSDSICERFYLIQRFKSRYDKPPWRLSQ
jgi:hypothetical protein